MLNMIVTTHVLLNKTFTKNRNVNTLQFQSKKSRKFLHLQLKYDYVPVSVGISHTMLCLLFAEKRETFTHSILFIPLPHIADFFLFYCSFKLTVKITISSKH